MFKAGNTILIIHIKNNGIVSEMITFFAKRKDATFKTFTRQNSYVLI